jgi:hypothetical protein
MKTRVNNSCVTKTRVNKSCVMKTRVNKRLADEKAADALADEAISGEESAA